jgi:glycosyltransferase involved in cell wall biosynthesis
MTAAKSKLRLAVFNTQPPLFLGGVERRILETAKHLKNDVTMTVYSGTKAGLRKVTQLNHITVVPCFSTDKVFPLDNWTFNQTLSRNAGTFKADIYETHTASGYGLINSLQKHNAKAPIVQTIHGVLADEYAQAALHGGLTLKQQLANLLMWQLAKHEEQAAKKSTLIVTISQYSKKKLLQYYDVDPAKIRLVPNGVDTDRFIPEGECEKIRRRVKLGSRQMVLFVGRLIPRKGVGYLIEAAKQVIKERKDTMFVLVGNGPMRLQLVSNIEAAGLKRNFVFLGDVSEEDLPQIYRCADVFVLPSIQEGQGIVLLEAQASGKPVVAFNVSGIAEAVKNKETGLLFKPGSSDELAQGILKILSDNSLQEKMGKKGREFVLRELSWDISARKLLSVYREAIELATV